jgi:hypothetical protein
MTTKNLALAASISGQALAARPHRKRNIGAQRPAAQTIRRAFNAIDPPMSTQTMEPNAHRYHGGPKYND